AIVVVEDVSRLLSTGKYNRYDATVKSMKELQSPLIGEVLVLMAVFIPTAFISGITGELYKQFALTIAVSTAFSGINALTLTPALCALILKPAKNEFFVYRYFNKYFNKTLNGYTTAITHILRRPVIAFIVFLGLTGLAFFGYAKWPSSYVPNEDLGYFITSVQLPSGASLERSQETTEKVMAMIKELPQVKDVITLSGMSVISGGTASNMGTLFVVLNNWNERKGYENSVFAIIDKVNIMTSSIEEAIIFSINPPAIPGLGTSGGLELALLDINNLGADEMTRAIGELEVAVAANDKLASIQTLYEGTVPQYQLNIDRNKVEMQQLNLSSVFSALSLYMGQSYVNDFVDFGRIFQVRLSAEALSRSNIGDVLKLSVRNSEGKMVPFSSFTTIEPTMGLSVDNRYNMYSSASLTFNTKPNISSNEGIKATEEVITSTLGNSYGYSWTGQAYQENQSGASVVLVLILAIIVTILVLAAQYESWTDPIAVVLSMPIAILGTVLGAIVMGQSISIYTQIGIILILGLSAKNAILIVEYAVDFRHNGETIRNAAIHAGRIRFRPIVMTAIAFVVGVMPMMLATGAGAESRISLGTAVVFGMAVNALIGTLLIPNFWELMENIRERYLMNLFKDDTVTTANDDELDKPQL
ncbi:MAG: efflux RND transporter permease subunit, partial [Bacteroidales bacterium]